MFSEVPLFQYFIYTLGLTVSAVMFSMAVENWREEKYKYVYAVAASVLFTPLGAWVISTVSRFYSIQKKVGTLA